MKRIDKFSYLLTIFLKFLWWVVAIEEFAFEQLNANNGKYELEQRVDDKDVDYILQRVHHTIEYSL